tara:strand:- start:347 stop:586 length:240 start_codon:yes stop_codon:yes gene_type:complete
MNEELLEKIVSNKGTILIFIDDSGEVMMLTSGELSKDQIRSVTKVITIIDEHSFVLKFILFLEIFFNNILFRLDNFFKK